MKLKEKFYSWITKKRVSLAKWLAPSIKAEAYKEGYSEGVAEGFEKGRYEAFRQINSHLHVFHMIDEVQIYVENVLNMEASVSGFKSEVASISEKESREMMKEVAKSMLHV